MTSKQRANLMSRAVNISPSVQIGKDSLTPEVTKAAEEALEANELIKINVQNNCFDDIRELAAMLAERTRSDVVQTIGHKIVLYKPASDPEKRKIDINSKKQNH